MISSRDLATHLLACGTNPHILDGEQSVGSKDGYWRIRGTVPDGTCIDAYFIDIAHRGTAQPHPGCALWLTIREPDGVSQDAYELGLRGTPAEYELSRPRGVVHEVLTYCTRALPIESYPAFLARVLDVLRDPALVRVSPRGFLHAGPVPRA